MSPRAEGRVHLFDDSVLIEENPMPSFTNPNNDAEEAREALRGLAHATQYLDDPTEIYPVLGSITHGLASLAQALHQLGDFHDGPALNRAWVSHDARKGRSASYKVSWELHRAAEMLHQAAESIDRAHEVEATIAYDIGEFPAVRESDRPSLDHGIGR
jgi:hypothetical protein